MASSSDLAGKLAVVTGANSGIGLEATVQLAQRGCTVVMCCRDLARGQVARDDAMKRSGVTDQIQILLAQLDLADLDNVGTFRARYDALPVAGKPVDMLILNAGVMAYPTRQLTKQGLEAQMATNHFGHFKFAASMFDLCKKASHCRVVAVSSLAHKDAKNGIAFDDLTRDKKYDPWGVYAETKLANLLFMEKLNRLLAARKMDNVVAVGCHPGVSKTNLMVGAGSAASTALRFFAELFFQSGEMGAKPTVLAATDPAAVRNGYAGPDGWFELRGNAKWGAQLTKWVKDEQQQDQLWAASEKVTGTPFVV